MEFDAGDEEFDELVELLPPVVDELLDVLVPHPATNAVKAMVLAAVARSFCFIKKDPPDLNVHKIFTCRQNDTHLKRTPDSTRSDKIPMSQWTMKP